MKKILLLLSVAVTGSLFGSHKVKIKNKSGEPVQVTISYGVKKGDLGGDKYDMLFLNVGMEKKVSIDHDDREGFCCPSKVAVRGLNSESQDIHIIKKKSDEHKFIVRSDKHGNVYID